MTRAEAISKLHKEYVAGLISWNEFLQGVNIVRFFTFIGTPPTDNPPKPQKRMAA